jgi:glycosyltransferase involved in cell wall biosynthesis
MASPFFSVLVTAYNRADHAERCVRSCMQQTYEDFEIVVVDDGSTDGTAAALADLGEPRLRVVRHKENRGISPARATAVEHARGDWLVMLDSDWTLLPHSLDRLHTLIERLPQGIRIIRSRLRSDDGHIDPGVWPASSGEVAITDYHGRLLWLEAVAVANASSDAGHCMHRSVFETTKYFTDRRGAMETLWELNLARRESSLWAPDILGLQHTDASDSHTRGADASRLIPRLLAEAPDGLWMAETMLAEHGAELARHAPHYRRWLLENAAVHAFLARDRIAGIRHTWAAVRAGSVDAHVWATLVLGIAGPKPLAYAKLARRRGRAGLRTTQS